MRRSRGALLIGLAMIVAGWANAATIVVANPGFEQTSGPFTNSYTLDGTTQNWTPANIESVPGWDFTPAGNGPAGDSAGVWAPTFDAANGLFISPFAGTNVGYSNGGKLSQVLSVSSAPNTYYTFTVAIGRRGDAVTSNPIVAPQIYTVQLFAGQYLLGQISGNTSYLANGTWNVVTFQAYSDQLPSGLLKIVLQASGPQVDFDEVMLSSIPEPGTYVLMGSSLVLLGWLLQRRRKSA